MALLTLARRPRAAAALEERPGALRVARCMRAHGGAASSQGTPPRMHPSHRLCLALGMPPGARTGHVAPSALPQAATGRMHVGWV